MPIEEYFIIPSVVLNSVLSKKDARLSPPYDGTSHTRLFSWYCTVSVKHFMKIIDLYSKLKTASLSGQNGYAVYRDDPELQGLEKLAKDWGMDVESTREWLQTPEAIAKENVARQHLEQAPTIIQHVESAFETKLPGVVILSPSYGEFDGFARYDRGEHTVILGIDFPDADVDYLKALTAHELSHVYRDHAPEVWSHLGKPLKEISRKEYLEAGTAQEHLVSEGLRHSFLADALPGNSSRWFITITMKANGAGSRSHTDQIHRSLIECLKGDAKRMVVLL